MRGQEQEHEQEEIRGTGYEFGKLFCSLQQRGFVTSNKHETACCCLLIRRRQQGKPSVLVRNGSSFLMTFIIGVKSDTRIITNVTLNISLKF